MPVRITGMNSGLDTEAIISSLVSNYKVKADNSKKAQTKLSWKQDAWKDVNKKVYSLYTGLDKVRFSSGFNLKKTTVSDPGKATVSATGKAINGTQTLAVKKLAATGYMTSNKLQRYASDGTASKVKVDSDTKLSDIGFSSDDEGEIEVGVGGNKTKISVTKDTTVGDFVKAINNAKNQNGTQIDIGVTASFDENSGRIFLAAKKAGAQNDFTVKSLNDAGQNALAALGLGISTSDKAVLKTASLAEVDSAGGIDEAATKAKLQTAFEALNTADTARKAAREEYDKTNSYIKFATGLKNLSDHDSDITAHLNSEEVTGNAETAGAAEAWDRIKQGTATEDDYQLFSKAMEGNQYAEDAAAIGELANSDLEKANTIANPETYSRVEGSDADGFSAYINELKDANVANTAALNAADRTYQNVRAEHKDLAELYEAKGSADDDAINAAYETIKAAFEGKASISEPARIEGSDAEIELNGATFTSESNDFEINGLKITATGLTGDTPITINTSLDSQGIYDKMKEWISGYNDVINNLSKLYNAESSKGYDPLTDEEKAEMSETEIEKWEDKIKSSILRRDGTLDSIMNTMITSMSKSYDVTMKDGSTQKMSLGSLGIQSMGYGVDKEIRYALHINGDADDAEFSGKKDSLMAMINEDPDAVAELFSKVTQGLYESLDAKMKSSSMSSAYTIYNDKQMKTEYSSYTKQIKSWEDKRTEAEDRYYKQFAAMEKMLANINSSTSSLTGMMG